MLMRRNTQRASTALLTWKAVAGVVADVTVYRSLTLETANTEKVPKLQLI
jgi:hypothetical protein